MGAGSHESNNSLRAHQHLTYSSSNGYKELYTLSAYHCFTTSFDGEEHAVMLEKLFKNAWHWYMAYMTWEDKQIENEG